MSLLQLQTNRCKELSANSLNICHARQYIIIEHKGSYVMNTTQHTQFSTVIHEKDRNTCY